MSNDKDVDRHGQEFDSRPEDTVPMWMLDDVELGVQIMRDDEERRREIADLHAGPTLREWEPGHAEDDSPEADEPGLPPARAHD